MKKIVELLIKDANFESDDLGVDVVSLVETPAIGYTWLAFGQEEVETTSCKCGQHHEMSEEDADQLEQLQNHILTAAQLLGEEHDPKMTTYLTIHNFEEGATVKGIIDAISALDILTSSNDATEELQTVYKYEGPSAERRFCRAMMRLSATKFWTRAQINETSASAPNPGFGRFGADRYDIFKYAGGPNCYHAFREYKMVKDQTTGRTLLIATGKGPDAPINQPNDGWYSRASRSRAAQKAAQTRNRGGAIQLASMDFSVQDEDQRIVVAPAMVPNNLIRRLDENGMEYYVYFSKDTVAEIAEKFFANNYTNNTDINHDGSVTKENTILESWIVSSPEHDKSNLYGFNVPEGTWMLSMRINNDETWSKIKNGELKGYSVAGNFLELAK